MDEINEFNETYENIHKTTIPNKVHIIMHHLSEYFDRFLTSLRYYSDQTIESTHQEFGKRLEAGNYNVKNHRSYIHGKKLLKGTIHYNSYNFGYGV